MINSKPIPQSVIKSLFILSVFLGIVLISLLVASYYDIDIIDKFANLKRDDGKKVAMSSKQKLNAVTIDGVHYYPLVTVNKDTLYNRVNFEDTANSIAITNTIDSTMMGKKITWRNVKIEHLPSGITTISK